MANMVEKQGIGHEAEHVETNSLHDSTEKNDLEKTHTLGVVDVENKAAYKGDDSDGHIEWGFKNLAAAFFLCMLYTGKSEQPHAMSL